MHDPRPLRGSARRYALWAGLILLLALLCWMLGRLSNPAFTPHDDFISSWAAGQLNARGRNPYDPAQVLAVQRTAGWTSGIPYRIWYPPFAMPLLAPFGLLPYPVSRFLWYVLHLVASLVSADFLWRYYGGPARSRGLSWVLVFAFWPALIDFRTGQVSVLILLGLVGFLHFEKKQRWMMAGACLTLIAVKPLLLHLLWVVLLLWVVRERRWLVVVSAAATCLILTMTAAASNSAVVQQFLHMAAYDAPTPLVSTPGTLLRLIALARTGQDRFWLQFVPALFSIPWMVFYWRRHRETWQWHEQMPVVLLASLLTTSYGWIYDDMVLLIPVMQVAVALLKRCTSAHPAVILVGYAAINVAIVTMNVVQVDAVWYMWVPCAFLTWYANAGLNGLVPRDSLAPAHM